MTAEEFTDIVLGLLQKEMSESADISWAQIETGLKGRFTHYRDGNALHVREVATGDTFIITVNYWRRSKVEKRS